MLFPVKCSLQNKVLFVQHIEMYSLCPAAIGQSRVISPEVPFSIEDLTSDHIFYVQNIRQANIRQDVFSFYISDGSSQTEAFDITIDIQV